MDALSARLGHYVQESKAHYYRSMIALMGGLEALAMLRAPYMVRLFSYARLRKGHAYTVRRLTAIAEPREQMPVFEGYLRDLVRKEALMRGYVLRCPRCDLETWYPFDQVQARTTCQGCRAAFSLPLEADFRYKLNRLFAIGLSQGALTVLLTLLWLHDRYESVTWQASVIVERHELDLVAVCDGDLVVVECKDNFDPAALPEQVARARGAVQADQFIFATLQEDVNLSDVRTLTRGDLLT